MKEKQITKEQITIDIKKVAKKYKKEFPLSKDHIGRDYYRSNGKYGTKVEKVFGSFKNAVNEIFPETGKERSQLDIYKCSKGIKGKRYIVSSIIANSSVDLKFFESIELYAKEKNAEIVLLAMRGVNKNDKFSDEVLNTYGKYIFTEYEFNQNLKAVDFLLDPSQIISLTGISRMAKKGASLLVGHSKLALEVIPSIVGEFPSLMYATGTVCDVKYRNDRIGRIASQDHTKSAIIVEIVDQKKFHVRNVICGSKGEFIDLGTCYDKNKTYKVEVESVLGDIHAGTECLVAVKATEALLKEVDCKKIYLNDLFDARSINPHEKDNIYFKYKRPSYQKSLEEDLNYLGSFIQSFCKDIKNKEFIVIPSNHNDFVKRYLQSGEFIKDSAENIKLACELFQHYFEGTDPIEYYLNSRNFLKSIKIKFCNRDDNLVSNSFSTPHGDKGNNGGRGSASSFDKVFNKSITGHSHSPQIFRSSARVGCLCLLRQDYISGTGSSWLHSNALTYPNGTFQLIHIIDGAYKLDCK